MVFVGVMKVVLFMVMLKYIVFVVAFVFISQATANESGLKLAHQVYNRPDGSDMSLRITMSLVEKGKQARVRQLYFYRSKERDVVRSLIRFTMPADVNGIGMLTTDEIGVKTKQWLYLPELDKVRRVSTSRKGGRFVGSDLFYEDLRDRPVEKDHHKLIGKGDVNGIRCQVIESIPVEQKNSVYTKRVSWVDADTLLPLRVDYYKKAVEPIKRLVVHKFEKIQGYWTVLDSTMTDLKSHHQTRLVVELVKYNRLLPDKLLSKRALPDIVLEESYRLR